MRPGHRGKIHLCFYCEAQAPPGPCVLAVLGRSWSQLLPQPQISHPCPAPSPVQVGVLGEGQNAYPRSPGRAQSWDLRLLESGAGQVGWDGRASQSSGAWPSPKDPACWVGPGLADATRCVGGGLRSEQGAHSHAAYHAGQSPLCGLG